MRRSLPEPGPDRRGPHVISGNTITVVPDWTVAPDTTTSVIGTGTMNYRFVVYNNLLQGKTSNPTTAVAVSGLQAYVNSADFIFSDNTLTNMRSGIVQEWAQNGNGTAPFPGNASFNLYAYNNMTGSDYGTIFVTNGPSVAASIIGHFGNSFRDNTLSGLTEAAINFTMGSPPNTGAGFEQQVYENNTATNLPKAINVEYGIGASGTIFTPFVDTYLNGNSFTLGTATFSGSSVFSKVDSPTMTWICPAANTYSGFQTLTPPQAGC